MIWCATRYPRPVNIVGREVVNTAEMARPLFWAFAALLAFGTPARAAELCDAGQARANQTQQTKTDPRQGSGDKDKKGDKGEPQRRHWWVESRQRAELGITDPQSAAIEQIWQRELPKLRETREKLMKLEEELTRLTNDNSADEAAVIAKIDAVEAARADGNRRRTAMIYRMHKVLTPEQRAKVKAMFESRDQQRRHPPTSR